MRSRYQHGWIYRNINCIISRLMGSYLTLLWAAAQTYCKKQETFAGERCDWSKFWILQNVQALQHTWKHLSYKVSEQKTDSCSTATNKRWYLVCTSSRLAALCRTFPWAKQELCMSVPTKVNLIYLYKLNVVLMHLYICVVQKKKKKISPCSSGSQNNYITHALYMSSHQEVREA